MATKIVNFKVQTAHMGQTVRHIKSQQHYIVGAVLGGRAILKSPRGGLGVVGEGCLSEEEFVGLEFGPYVGVGASAPGYEG